MTTDYAAPGTRRITSSIHHYTVDVPEHWDVKAGAAVDESLPLLFTAISGASPLRRLDDCAAWSQVDTVLVQVQETLAWPRMRIGGQIVDPRRPDRFGPSFGSERSIVCPGVHFREILFNDRRRGFDVIVGVGPENAIGGRSARVRGT